MFENYIFDIDGTLVDTSKDVIEGLRQGFALADLPLDYSDKELIDFVGPPLEKMVENMSPSLDEHTAKKVVLNFRKCYSEFAHKNSFLYPEVKEILEELTSKGKKLFVATNKPQKFALDLLEKFSLTMFQETFTSDYFDDKLISKSEMINYLIAKYDLNKSKTVMVGDSKADIIGAFDNEIKSIFVTYGFGNLKNAPEPTYIVNRFSDIY